MKSNDDCHNFYNNIVCFVLPCSVCKVTMYKSIASREALGVWQFSSVKSVRLSSGTTRSHVFSAFSFSSNVIHTRTPTTDQRDIQINLGQCTISQTYVRFTQITRFIAAVVVHRRKEITILLLVIMIFFFSFLFLVSFLHFTNFFPGASSSPDYLTQMLKGQP